MGEPVSYYLWRGVDAIEDVEPVAGEREYLSSALDALAAKVAGDWTLWRRQGTAANLVAVRVVGEGVWISPGVLK